MSLKRHVLAFRKTVPAGGDNGDGLTPGFLSYNVTSPCTIEEINMRFYPGQERSLRIDIFVMHQSELREQVFTYVPGGDNFISGDDDVLKYPVTLAMEPNDTIWVQYTNTSTAYPYDMVCDIVLDQLGGTDSAR